MIQGIFERLADRAGCCRYKTKVFSLWLCLIRAGVLDARALPMPDDDGNVA